jgi:hypothetical protein
MVMRYIAQIGPPPNTPRKDGRRMQAWGPFMTLEEASDYLCFYVMQILQDGDYEGDEILGIFELRPPVRFGG